MQSKDALLDELTSKVYFLSLKVERLEILLKQQEEDLIRLKKLEDGSYLSLLAQYGIGDELPETD